MARAVPLLLLVIVSACPAAAAAASPRCEAAPVNLPEYWKTLSQRCASTLVRQTKMEIEASLLYMEMGVFFSRDVVNRPGFSKFFFDKSFEEREMAIEILSYLAMRGYSLGDPMWLQGVAPFRANNASDAVGQSVAIEIKCSQILQDALAVCEDRRMDRRSLTNDANVVNYFGGDFLERKLRAQRKLVGMLSTLKQMEEFHSAVGEFLYDNKLLDGEV